MSDNIAEINRKLPVFLHCHMFRSDFEDSLGVIGPAEFDGAQILAPPTHFRLKPEIIGF